MYTLLFRLTNGLETLRKQYELHVKKVGIESVQKIMPVAGAGAEGSKAEGVVSQPFKLCPPIRADRMLGSQGVCRGVAWGTLQVQRSGQRTLQIGTWFQRQSRQSE